MVAIRDENGKTKEDRRINFHWWYNWSFSKRLLSFWWDRRCALYCRRYGLAETVSATRERIFDGKDSWERLKHISWIPRNVHLNFLGAVKWNIIWPLKFDPVSDLQNPQIPILFTGMLCLTQAWDPRCRCFIHNILFVLNEAIFSEGKSFINRYQHYPT